jgi:hypothetical protein
MNKGGSAALGTVCLFKAGDGNNVLEWLGEIAAVGSLSPNHEEKDVAAATRKARVED